MMKHQLLLAGRLPIETLSAAAPGAAHSSAANRRVPARPARLSFIGGSLPVVFLILHPMRAFRRPARNRDVACLHPCSVQAPSGATASSTVSPTCAPHSAVASTWMVRAG